MAEQAAAFSRTVIAASMSAFVLRLGVFGVVRLVLSLLRFPPAVRALRT